MLLRARRRIRGILVHSIEIPVGRTKSGPTGSPSRYRELGASVFPSASGGETSEDARFEEDSGGVLLGRARHGRTLGLGSRDCAGELRGGRSADPRGVKARV
ncbi:hypothetical protein KM043_003273 [Ampulex compressa]|nr:hypothetical protein KM043_003273 [Ampulex compressa]